MLFPVAVCGSRATQPMSGGGIQPGGLSLDFRVLWVPGYPASAAATSAILAACSELPQFPADLEGLTGMLLVEQKDPSGDQHQAEHGDGRPAAGRPSHGDGPADRCRSASPRRLALIPAHQWMAWVRLDFHCGEAARSRCRPGAPEFLLRADRCRTATANGHVSSSSRPATFHTG